MGKQVAGLEGLDIDWAKVVRLPEVGASIEGVRSIVEARANNSSPSWVHYGGNTEPGKKKPRAPKGIVSTLGEKSFRHELRHNTLLSSL